MARMVASVSAKRMGTILSQVGEAFFDTFSETRAHTIRTFAAGALADGQAADIDAVLTLLQREPGKLVWWKPALLQGLAKLPPSQIEAAKQVAILHAQVDAVLTQSQSTLAERLAVLPLLSQRKFEAVQPMLSSLLTSHQDPEMVKGALTVLKGFPSASTSPFIYEMLPQASPALKGQLVAMLAGNPNTALELFQRMDRGELPTALVDIETRWRWQRGSGELRDLAVKLFGQPSGDRAAVLANYMEATKKPGDPTRGKAVFSSVCIACHKLGELGMEVGPSLADVKVKLPEALLSDILDPNRMFEARWSAYQVDTLDGRSLSGLLTSETPDAVEITMMAGIKERIPRSQIRLLKSLDRSLMPVGLEAGISPEQMADLLAFLCGR
jgi:putative heme-binding domain-containing protein